MFGVATVVGVVCGAERVIVAQARLGRSVGQRALDEVDGVTGGPGIRPHPVDDGPGAGGDLGVQCAAQARLQSVLIKVGEPFVHTDAELFDTAPQNGLLATNEHTNGGSRP
jgi:hypothetical protein